MNPPKAERAKPSLSSDYNLLFKNKIGESSLDIHREETRREIDRLCQTAEDQLAEEQALKEARLKAEREREYLEYRNQALSKELEETKAELSRVATELGKERLMLQKAELEVSGLQAAVDTLRQVILVLKQKAIPKMSGKKV